MSATRLPESVLLVVYAPDLQVLLLDRLRPPGGWQSVTGARASTAEPLAATCVRELAEETGRACAPDELEDWRLRYRYPIPAARRPGYGPGITHNVEHVFALRVPSTFVPVLDPREHAGWCWMPWADAAQACGSWTNAQVLRRLPERAAAR